MSSTPAFLKCRMRISSGLCLPIFIRGLKSFILDENPAANISPAGFLSWFISLYSVYIARMPCGRGKKFYFCYINTIPCRWALSHFILFRHENILYLLSHTINHKILMKSSGRNMWKIWTRHRKASAPRTSVKSPVSDRKLQFPLPTAEATSSSLLYQFYQTKTNKNHYLLLT